MDEDVRPRDEAGKRLLCGILLQIEHDTALVATLHQVGRGHAGGARGARLPANIALRRLDLEHSRAQLRQQPARDRGRAPAVCQLDDQGAVDAMRGRCRIGSDGVTPRPARPVAGCATSPSDGPSRRQPRSCAVP